MRARDKKKVSDEEVVPSRQTVREFSEGKFVTLVMAAVTIFALFGDDFRLWFTTKQADVWIDGALIVSLVAFTVEILVNSCVVDDFKYSFFFWLDIIATVSIMVDVKLLSDTTLDLFGLEGETGDAQMGQMASNDSGDDRMAKIIKALRLIRLIRIIKLYKYLVKSGSEMEEQRLREQQKQSSTQSQAALNRELEPSRLGRSLSEALTRRLIILVLTLLMALPAITYGSFDAAHQYGLRQLFWFGKSNCKQIDGDFQCQEKLWMSKAGWEEHLRNFISAASPGEAEPLSKEVLWIHVPDFTRNGVIGDIKNVTNRETHYGQLWGGLDYISGRYDVLAMDSINKDLDRHRNLFKADYESLSASQVTKFEILLGGLRAINPFETNKIDDLYGAGLTQAKYEELIESFKKVNSTLSQTLKEITDDNDVENFKFIYRYREYFKTLEFDYDDVSEWLIASAEEKLIEMGVSTELVDIQVADLMAQLSQCHKEDDSSKFDFYKLLFAEEYSHAMTWAFSLNWKSAIPLTWLQRNWFVEELYWKEDPNCGGYKVDHKSSCDLRAKELKLLTYTPQPCLDGTEKGCRNLISYVRLSIKGIKEGEAMLQFITTIFTCIILSAGAIMFANDTQELIINPITKMVGIIKTLADNPLQKPEPPIFEEEETDQKGQMKTVELQKTIFRIGNLLQMSFGQLGAIIIRDSFSSGEGNLEIMIPGQKINAIFMICKINAYTDYTDVLKTNFTDFLNKITQIVHQCANRWDGWANKTDGNKFLITWKLPEIETNSKDAERNEALQEQRTEMADESLIAAIKIISEIRRANQFNAYYRKTQMIQRFQTTTRPHLTFGLHMGWTVQGAIGSDNKIDACYLSPQLQIANRLEELTQLYEMQIILSEPLYNYMSLKARNTLRKIDVILLNIFGHQGLQAQVQPMGIYTFDMSFNNAEVSEVPEEHQIGDLIKLTKYENINIENFKNRGVDYMFTLDGDIVGLQQHIMEFNPIFRQAFKCYISGDWGNAFEHIERCLELWEDDGPTKAIQRYMACFQFSAPSDWANCRNLDEVVQMDDIGLDDVDGEDEVEANGADAAPPGKKDETLVAK